MPSFLERTRRIVFGRPIATSQADHSLLPKTLALPVFASDAISSSVYATQQILLALGVAGLWMVEEKSRYGMYTLLISAMIVALLTVVVVSYWQTIYAYPNGGGSYIVSKENLGTSAGLVAAGALLIDYVLTVSVSIASGVQNLASIPFLQRWNVDQHMVAWCLAFIVFLTVANLRGLKESSTFFAIFTYGFVFMCLLMIAIGILAPLIGWQFDTREVDEVYRTFPGGSAAKTAEAFGMMVILRAFANGCCAMTGTEAVSNGIPAFQEDKCKNAAVTLTIMAVILGVLFVGISWLAIKLHVVYWEEGGRTAPAVIDQLSGAIFGKSGFFSFGYLATQFFTAAILVLAANTSYADFPRLSSILARDGFLPRQLTSLGDKLVFENGIILLGAFAAFVIIEKNGSVDALIPLYAIGVFIAFTLSQVGMVVHWFKVRDRGWQRRAVINGIGASATFLVLIDLAVEKFEEGAWVIMLLIGGLYLMFRKIRSHYSDVANQLKLEEEYVASMAVGGGHTALVLISGVHRGIIPAMEYADAVFTDCRAVYIELDPAHTEHLKARWNALGMRAPLVILKSPFRSLVRPLIKYIHALRNKENSRFITILLPEFVPTKWWHHMLHGNTGFFLRLALLGQRNLVISNVRFFLKDSAEEQLVTELEEAEAELVRP